MSTLQLFGIAVAIWGTSWIAIKAEIAAAAPEVAVALRFSLAALLLFGWCRWRGVRLEFGRRTHALFDWIGYDALCHLFARLLFGTPLTRRVPRWASRYRRCCSCRIPPPRALTFGAG